MFITKEIITFINKLKEHLKKIVLKNNYQPRLEYRPVKKHIKKSCDISKIAIKIEVKFIQLKMIDYAKKNNYFTVNYLIFLILNFNIGKMILISERI
jgi:hypothetical protein